MHRFADYFILLAVLAAMMFPSNSGIEGLSNLNCKFKFLKP